MNRSHTTDCSHHLECLNQDAAAEDVTGDLDEGSAGGSGRACLGLDELGIRPEFLSLT